MTLLTLQYRLDELHLVAKQIWEKGKTYAVWSFSGDMGAGKTTLISAICQLLNVQDAVSSPTYAIVNEYAFTLDGKPQTIYHCDWYRLKDAEDARDAGMEDILYRPGTFSFIEWASQAPALLNKSYLSVEIEVLGETERRATLKVI